MRYSLIDLHADTASEALDKNEGFYKNSLHLDLEKMNACHTQFFAAFISPKYSDAPMERAILIIKKIKSEILKNNKRLVLCKSFEDYLKNAGKARAFLSLEGGEPISDKEALLKLYNEGVRLIAPCWNYKNRLCTGVLEGENSGVSDFGKEIFSEMNRLGIIIDVSHMNDKSFWDTMKISKKPVIASHSNSRSVCFNKRNLTDEQFLAIKKCGGVVGINFYPRFLKNDGEAKIEDIIEHIEHFLSLGGEENIVIGADFDGVDSLPKGIFSASDTYLLFDAMLRQGYSEELVRKISCTNMEGFLKENL